jgi:hypothetical protein
MLHLNNKVIESNFQTKEDALNYKNTLIKGDYTSQALINTKIAALKEANKKYPRSLIRSSIKKIKEVLYDEAIHESLFEEDELPFQKIPTLTNSVNAAINNDLTRRSNESSQEENTSINEAVQDSPDIRNDKLFTEVNKKMYSFLDKVGIDIKNVEVITDSNNNPIDAVAKADIYNKTVEVIEEKRKMDTLPEEASHIYIDMLGEDNPLYQRMMDKITRFNVYKDVKAQYVNVYGENETKFRKEAIGKLIAQEIVGLKSSEINESDLNKNLFNKWWTKVWNWIKDTLGLLNSRDLSPFIESAKSILEGKVEGLLTIDEVLDFNENSQGLSYYQLSEENISERDRLNEEFKNKQVERDFETGGYKTKNGHKVKSTVNDFVKALHNKMWNKRFIKAKDRSTLSLKTSYIAAVNSAIMNELISGKTTEQLKEGTEKARVSQEVVTDLLRSNEFTDAFQQDETFFVLSQKQYDELVDGISSIYNQIQENSTRISRLIQEDEGNYTPPRIYTDFSVYDAEEDVAGTVDLLVVYPNGSVGNYHYKGIRFRTSRQTGEVIENLSEYNLEEYDLYADQYKKILRTQYGIKNFAETRVIPMNVQLNFKRWDGTGLPETTGIRTIEIGDKQGREYLEQIPAGDELTEDKGLNEALDKMILLRKSIRHSLRNNPENERLNLRLKQITSSIKEIQLNRNLVFSYNEVTRMFKQLEARESAPEGTPDALDITELNDYIEFASVFENFSVQVADSQDIIEDEHKDKISRISHLSGRIKKIALDKIVEHFNKEDLGDITADVVETGQLGRLFKQLHSFDQPTFKRMAQLVRQNSEDVRKEINDTIADITVAHDKLEDWAKSKGISMLKAFDKIYNKKTGKLIPKFKSNYFEDLNEARRRKDKKWILDNTEFDETSFKKNRDEYFKLLDKLYADESVAELKQQLKEEWLNKYDISHNENAFFNNKNYYFSLKDNSDYYSDNWTELLKEGNEPLKEYYDKYIEYNDKFNKLVSRRIDKGFVAEIRQDTIDRLSQVGASAFKDLFKNLQHALEIREFDISNREIDPDTKKPRPIIPLFFMDKVRDKLNKDEIQNIKDSLIRDGYIEDTVPYNSEFENRKLSKEFEKGREYKSYDLTRNLVLFAESVYTNKFANDTEQLVRALQNINKSNRIKTTLVDPSGVKIINKIKGKTVETQGMSLTDQATFDKFVNMYWYGMNVQNQDLKIGKDKSLTKLAQKIMQYTSLNALAFKPILAAGNWVGLTANTKIAAAEGILYNKKQLRKAHRLLGNGMWFTKNDPKAIMSTKFFEVSARNLTYEKANNLSASKLSKNLTMDNAFIMHKKADDYMDNVILLSMMQNYGIDNNGKLARLAKLEEGTQSLWDNARMENDNLVIPNLNEENFNLFRQIVRKASTGIKGSIPEDNKNLIGTHVMGQALMQFRNWIPGLAETRFKKITFDPEMQELDVGRFRVIAGEFARSKTPKQLLNNVTNLMREILISAPIASRFTGRYSIYKDKQNKYARDFYFKEYLILNPDMEGKITLEQFEELRAAKLRGMAKELSMMFSFLAITALLRSLIPDDDEELIYEFFAKNTYYAANRGLLEMTFWTSPESVNEILKSPLPSFRVFSDLQKWIDNTIDVTSDIFLEEGNPKKAVFSKASRDKSPAFYRTFGMIPMVSAGVDVIDTFDKALN